MRKIQRRDFLKTFFFFSASHVLTAGGGSGAASASSVSRAPASSSSAPSASAQPESAEDKAAPAGAPVTQFQTGELKIGDYTFKAEYIGGTCCCSPPNEAMQSRTSSSVTVTGASAVTVPLMSCVSVAIPR